MSPFFGARLDQARAPMSPRTIWDLAARHASPSPGATRRRMQPAASLRPRPVVGPDCGIYTMGLLRLFARKKRIRDSGSRERTRIALSVSTSGDFAEAEEPLALFRLWLEEAVASEINDPEAMTLSTVDEGGLPDARMVLCKGADAAGLVFYTNAESAKGLELAARPKAAALFHWKSLRRQVRFRGPVALISDAEADAYFATRPNGSRIGAWASQQSRPLKSRAALEAAVEAFTLKFGEGDIPRPDYWRGYRLQPNEIEFWSDGAFRLHDRILFRRPAPGAPWRKERLYP
jgi:pyridoxamine 5'-phosphate oxidase